MLQVKFSDILRATLPLRSGNEGWLGFSPKGDLYHVVVPVDVQIARGVMACNRPTDGTPFGGYAKWLYFRCPPFEDEGGQGSSDESARIRQASATARLLIKWLSSYGIEATVDKRHPSEQEEASSVDAASEESPAGRKTETHDRTKEFPAD